MTTDTMNELDLNQWQAHIGCLAKNIKSEADLGSLTQQLVKMTVEAALGAELDEHLGYALPGVVQATAATAHHPSN
ncbi:hypothetical protein SAMN05216379_11347 [Nitrosomonas eutropha]|nr:hypothetical protein SAMN05216379_11347 [Nitrosomonas eutropha]